MNSEFSYFGMTGGLALMLGVLVWDWEIISMGAITLGIGAYVS